MRRMFMLAVAFVAAAFLAAGARGALPPGTVTITEDLVSPVFGLQTGPGQRLYAADSFTGIQEIRSDGATSLMTELPGVTDVGPVGAAELMATTSVGFGPTSALYRVTRDRTIQIADLAQFEEDVNPDGDEVAPTNPFDLAVLHGHEALVADAEANDLLIVDKRGSVDWVAVLPERLMPGPGGAPFPADPVPTSVAVGPDGAYYVTELTGFPATPGTSRVWRIAPGTRHALCGVSPACEVVADGLTSIIDMNFGPNGTAYVLELDEASWLALEEGAGVGGTLNACTAGAGPLWTCTAVATGLTYPTAVAVDGDDVYLTVEAVFPAFGPFGQAKVVKLP